MLADLRRLPRSLAFVYAGTTVNRAGAFVFPYLTIYLSQARGLTLGTVGAILSVGAVGLLVGNLAGGWLTDRWSRKGTLVAALVINAAGFLGLAFDYATPWSYAAFLCLGYLGTGLYQPAANTIIADLTDARLRPFAYTVHYVCINVGMALGPLIGGVLAQSSFRWVFAGDIVSSLACAALILGGVRAVAPSVDRSRTAATSSGTGSLIALARRHGLVVAFCLASFFLIAPLMGLEYAVPLLVQRELAGGLAWIGVIYTINAVCILALSFFAERLLRGRNEIPMMAVSGLLWSLGLAILVVGFSLPALVACTVVWTLGEIVASIIAPTFLSRRVAPEVKGRCLSLIDALRSLASIACPIALGTLWDAHGVQPVVLAILALPVLGTLAYLALWVVASTPARVEAAGLPAPEVTEP